MTPEEKIRRHGHHLMSLASMAMFGVGLYTLVMMGLASRPDPDVHLLEFHYGLRAEAPLVLESAVRQAIALAGGLLGLSWLLPLWMLRRLGYSLNREDAPSARTAAVLRHLAHAVLASLGIRFLAERVLDFSSAIAQPGQLEHVARLALGSYFLTLVACLCLYSLSHVIRLGAEAANDARSIV